LDPNETKLRSALSATLMRLAELGKVTRKGVAFATGMSPSEAGRWFSGDDLPKLNQFIDIITDIEIDADARLAIASSIGISLKLCDDKPGDPTVAGVVRYALSATVAAAKFSKRATEICADRIITSSESAEAVGMISEIECDLSEAKQNIIAHTARPVSPMRSAV
jgi:hypothetical protein